MRSVLLTLLLFSLHSGINAQALRDINYRYLYDVDEPFTFQIQPVRTTDGWLTHYKLALRDSLEDSKEYRIRWEIRQELSDKEGKLLTTDTSRFAFKRHEIVGQIATSLEPGKIYLTARIQNAKKKRAWYFFQELSERLPINCYLQYNGQPILHPYIKKNTPVQVSGMSADAIVSYYSEPFPAGAPPFSESQARVSKGLKADSIFQWPVGMDMSFQRKGLYLVQADTSSQNGISFRVEDDYPRLAKVESLADPLVYICTRDEFLRVKIAKGDKKAFDKVILGITGDAERAKTLFRSYFKRVELANEFFSSYKEGWKTDRGMAFIIFGVPDEVFRFDDREIWSYQLFSNFKLSLTFVRSSTLFDPDNFVLIRAKRYQDTWYSTIDLWRNARF
jgi:GWxTD domain-containing protein